MAYYDSRGNPWIEIMNKMAKWQRGRADDALPLLSFK